MAVSGMCASRFSENAQNGSKSSVPPTASECRRARSPGGRERLAAADQLRTEVAKDEVGGAPTVSPTADPVPMAFRPPPPAIRRRVLPAPAASRNRPTLPGSSSLVRYSMASENRLTARGATALNPLRCLVQARVVDRLDRADDGEESRG